MTMPTIEIPKIAGLDRMTAIAAVLDSAIKAATRPVSYIDGVLRSFEFLKTSNAHSLLGYGGIFNRAANAEGLDQSPNSVEGDFEKPLDQASPSSIRIKGLRN